MRDKREMPEIEEAKEMYIKALLKYWCDKYEKGENYGVEGMKELVRLTQQLGIGKPIARAGWKREIRWGVDRWWRYSTGVLDGKEDANGRVFYWIRSEFYEAIKQALSEYDQ